MSRMIARKQAGRLAVLALMVVAIMGPWAFTLDGVPPAEWCRAPLFLLENDRCAAPVSGMEIASFVGMAFVITLGAAISGALVLPDNSRELFGITFMTLCASLALLPFVTTALRLWRTDSRRLRIFGLAAWAAAAIVALLPLVFEARLRSVRYWGIWLFIALAASAFFMEVRRFKDEG